MNEGNDLALGYMMGQDGSNNNGNGGGFGFGDGGIWGLIIIALLFGGFGGRGFGGGGLFGGGGGNDCGARTAVADGFALNNIERGITGIQQGLCDGFYAQNTTMLQGFNGVTQGFNALGHQMSDCCCATQRAIDGVNYNLATQTNAIQQALCTSTRDIVDAQNAGTRAILDFLTQDKIATLTAENQSLKFAASQSAQNAFITANQEAQTAELIRRLGRDCPIPAYVVPNPNCCYGNPVGVSYGAAYGGNSGGCCGC